MKRYLFRKQQRLKSNEDFKAVLAHRCCAGNDLARVYVAKNTLSLPRLGVSVNKKCGNAVARNRLKRFAREVFRLQQYNIPPGYDYLLIFSRKMTKKAKSGEGSVYDKIDFDTFKGSFLDLVGRAVGRAESSLANGR